MVRYTHVGNVCSGNYATNFKQDELEPFQTMFMLSEGSFLYWYGAVTLGLTVALFGCLILGLSLMIGGETDQM